MKKFIAIAILGFSIPGAALAQGCQAPAANPADAAGVQTSCSPAGSPLVSGLSGNVSLVRAGNIIRLENGAQLLAGDRVIAREGSANVAIGATCSASIAANSITTITRSGGLTCVSQRPVSPVANTLNPAAQPAAQASLPGAVAVAPPATSGLSPLVYAIGGSVLAGAAGIAISQSGSNNRLSP